MPSTFDVASTSAGEMFLGAFVPGLVLVGLYMAYILVFALLRPKAAPAVRYDGAYNRAFWGKVCSSWCRRWRSSSSCWARSSRASPR